VLQKSVQLQASNVLKIQFICWMVNQEYHWEKHQGKFEQLLSFSNQL